MNERIRELVGQAGIPVIDGVWDYNDRNLLVKDNGEWRVAVPSEIISTMIDSEKGLEKFAELIVKECIATIENAVNGYEDYRNQIEDGMRNHCIDLIKNKFGIKE